MEVNRRQVAPQDVTWFLDLYDRGRLDLDPPYQRKSVWSINDRRYFLNTIFNNFPTPAIFLHRTIADAKATYHVVDGKQRLETIIRFAKNEFALGDDFGNSKLDKKKFGELDEELKHRFWNYQFIVEQLLSVESTYIREIFDRVNRNTRKLTRQEVRHARFEGWFAQRVDAEAEADSGVWKQFGVVTPTRARRMSDAQFIAETFILTIDKRITGFDQDLIDSFYSDYDDPALTKPDFSVDDFEEKLGATKGYLLALEGHAPIVTSHARTAAHFYSLWAVLTLDAERLPDPKIFSERYHAFMSQVEALTRDIVSQQLETGGADVSPAIRYFLNAQSATTDLGPRRERHEVLRKVVLDDEGAAVN
jgi:hypothetical protein